MFTGLVEKTGTIRERTRRGPGYRLVVETDLAGVQLGESIAVNGACLTVARLTGRGFEADVSLETAERTTLGELVVGSTVNLERALRLGDRMGGHLVSGHVDGIAETQSVEPAGEGRRVSVRYPELLAPYIAEKGSIALDGVSLTINHVHGSELTVMLVPHTWGVTNLRALAPGRRLNLEVDLLARYVVRYLSAAGAAASDPERSHIPDAPGSTRPAEEPLALALKRAGIL